MPDKSLHSIHKQSTKEELVELFFRNHYGELCKSVNRLLADQALSEDLVQEVFIKVWKRKDKIDFNDRFIFYLKRSCYHEALTYLSGNNYKLDTDPAENTTHSSSSSLPIEQIELEHEVRSAIGDLPEKTRLAFTLSRYEDMSYKEIAEQLNISLKTVEKHIGIALKRLREALKNHLTILFLLIPLL
ncbi:MAG: RNA polymerase sigma-70 factor [Marinoscillum sp.]